MAESKRKKSGQTSVQEQGQERRPLLAQYQYIDEKPEYTVRDKNDRRLNWRQACYVLHCGRTKFFDLIANGTLKWEGVGVRGHYVWESDCVKLLHSTVEDAGSSCGK